MATQRVAFTEWLPDQPSTTGALLASNKAPVVDGWSGNHSVNATL